jgi:hypothetical protein
MKEVLKMRTTKRLRDFQKWLDTLDNKKTFTDNSSNCIISEYFRYIYPGQYIEIGQGHDIDTLEEPKIITSVSVYIYGDEEREILLSPTELIVYNKVYQLIPPSGCYTAGKVKSIINNLLKEGKK